MSTKSKDFVCGWGAALIETSCTYPFSKIVVRQQLLGLCVSEAFQQLRTEGTAHLYRGLLPPLLQRTSSRCIMFGMYDEYKRIFSCSTSGSFTRCHAGAAFLAELEILRPNKPARILSWIIGSCITQRWQETNLSDSSHMKHIVGDLFTGLFLGAFISTVFFPVNVMKTRMQASVGVPFTSIWSTFRIVFAERGYSFRKLYRGLPTASLLSFSRNGLTLLFHSLLLHPCKKRSRL
ncbi:Mitochondrial nicotinamide adenine dinucleotide transporter SLC25A51 [Trichinella spiralis]|uniref:Mitochondrial nicotinamide adenine dinucleotide transporter SLC25A51 n=1 Tax=Trichinella spiralis TaxID=6334 RepID=A0ABR3KYC8_TRISP